MSGIKGEVREQTDDYIRRIGMFEGGVIAINPSEKEYMDLLGIELKEDSKRAIYLDESKDGNTRLRVDFWIQPKDENIRPIKVSFFLEDVNRMNKEEVSQQYINNIGVCSWAVEEDMLPSWFVNREYRKAHKGEEDFYGFLRSWLGGLNYSKDDTELELGWKDLMKGKLNILKELIGGQYAVNFISMATVVIKGEGDEMMEYQGIYNKGFLPAYSLRHFNLIDFSKESAQKKILAKESKDLKPHERFVKNASGEYGCKNIHSFKPLAEYIPAEHLPGTDNVVSGEGLHEETVHNAEVVDDSEPDDLPF